MRGMPPSDSPVTELVKLAMNVDEGRRGEIVAVPEARASQLFRARAATPVVERAAEAPPKVEPPAPAPTDDDVDDMPEGTPGDEDGDDGPSDEQPDVPQGDGTPAEHARMAARSRAAREGRDRREGTP